MEEVIPKILSLAPFSVQRLRANAAHAYRPLHLLNAPANHRHLIPLMPAVSLATVMVASFQILRPSNEGAQRSMFRPLALSEASRYI